MQECNTYLQGCVSVLVSDTALALLLKESYWISGLLLSSLLALALFNVEPSTCISTACCTLSPLCCLGVEESSWSKVSDVLGWCSVVGEEGDTRL